MVRRRKFLNKYFNSNLKVFKNDIIRENLYYNDKIIKFSNNSRFFWKKIYHANKYYNLFIELKYFSSNYKYFKTLYNMYSSALSIFNFNKIAYLFNYKNLFFHKNYLKKIKPFSLNRKKNEALTFILEPSLLFSLIKWSNNFYKLMIYNILKFILFLEKKIYFNNGVHSTFEIKRPLPFHSKFSKFNYLSNKNRNKNLFKRNLSRSLKPVSKKILFKKVLFVNNFKFLKFLIQFVLTSFNKKILSLFCSSNGSFFFSNATSLHYLFKFYKNFNIMKKKKFRFKKDVTLLFKLKRLDKICSFSFLFGANHKYATSVGSKALLIKIDKEKKIGVLKMPSTSIKIISLYTLALKGRIKCFSNKKLKETKASYLRLRGKKANSRGVSMNPIDHPHGGNTNSIKLHKTPWGLPTKKK